MCETIAVRHRCGYGDVKMASAYCKKLKSFQDKNDELVAGLKVLLVLLSWCSFQSNLPVGSIRLCPDCRGEKRRETRESRAPSEGWQRRHDWRWLKEWVSKEDEEMRGERKRVEAERREELERKLPAGGGWIVGRADVSVSEDANYLNSGQDDRFLRFNLVLSRRMTQAQLVQSLPSRREAEGECLAPRWNKGCRVDGQLMKVSTGKLVCKRLELGLFE
jgi:hypothetical protein